MDRIIDDQKLMLSVCQLPLANSNFDCTMKTPVWSIRPKLWVKNLKGPILSSVHWLSTTGRLAKYGPVLIFQH